MCAWLERPLTSVGRGAADRGDGAAADVLGGTRSFGRVAGVPPELRSQVEASLVACRWRWHFGCCTKVARSLGWSVALRAEGTPLVAWWNFCEGVGKVELGWRLFWSEVEKLEVFGQILGVGVCGGTGDA